MDETDVIAIQSRVELGGLPGYKATASANAPLVSDVDRYMQSVIVELDDTPAREAALYHLQTGGNRMRARLALASGASTLSNVDGIVAASACELLHNASLVHDDISDGDTYRRGKMTVCARYGRDVALCTGDLLLTAAFAATADMENVNHGRQLLKALTRASARIIGGQSIELAKPSSSHRYRRRYYLSATCAKTAPLVELSLGLGLVPDTGSRFNTTTCRALAEAIGLAYQILDDLDDLKTTDNGSAKPSFHELHAWVHHAPPGPKPHTGRTLRRCLWHANAALKRAEGLCEGLPDPLRECVVALLSDLRKKARQSWSPQQHSTPTFEGYRK